MKFEKVCTHLKPNGQRFFSIHTRCYGSTLEFLQKIGAEAKRLFPELKDGDLTVQKYGGRFISGIYGVEFLSKCEEVPEGFFEADDSFFCDYLQTK